MNRTAQILAVVFILVVIVIGVITVLIGPLGDAPLQGIREDILGREPIVISVAYGTEKEEWLREALQRFEAAGMSLRGRPIQVTLQGIGSREMVENIVQGDLQPVVVSPASSIQIELLREEWQQRYNSDIYATTPEPLVLTPLVLAAWEDRATTLWPEDKVGEFWICVHEVLTDDQGWASMGHPEWGLAKFGHTSPETSNSGIQTLVLLAYAYHQKTTGLSNQDILDADFQAWLDGIERSVLEFGDSTGTFMTNMIRLGPSKYDFVVVYENLAIDNIETAQGRWEQPLRIYYPPATILSDHPYAVLNADWVSPEQREAAEIFRDFLLSPEIQELALEYGFRPADPNIAIVNDSPNNPFNRFAEQGVSIDIAQQVEVPDASVLNELIEWWRRQDYE
ncbi:MAG: ABC transporter substrate-binding protein [Chloroflexaceae bacterium]|nr:ABC transporter substrate-binding protein [Chloroflexaceae bacterium]